jgi:PhnB protein
MRDPCRLFRLAAGGFTILHTGTGFRGSPQTLSLNLPWRIDFSGLFQCTATHRSPMSVKLNPYLNFQRETREAMEFYKTVFGGTLHLSTFKEGGMPTGPEDENLVMHSQLDSDHGITLMASDTPPGMELKNGNNVCMGLSGSDESTLRSYWDQLSPGGTVIMPLEKAPWGDTFGMCIDKFGIQWLVNISAQKA